MDSNTLYIIIGVIGLAVGVFTGKLIFAKNTARQVEEAEQKSAKILSEAQFSA